jgi:hypothetical protein
MIVLKMFSISMYKNVHVLLVSHKCSESGTISDGWDGNSMEQCSCKSVTVAWLAKKFPVFCETLGFIKTHQQGMLYTWLMCTFEIGGVLVWLLCSQDPAASAYPKLNKFSPHQESYFKTNYNIIHPLKGSLLNGFQFILPNLYEVLCYQGFVFVFRVGLAATHRMYCSLPRLIVLTPL